MNTATTEIGMPGDKSTRRLVRYAVLGAIVFALIAAGGIYNPAFLSPQNALVILRAAAMSGIVAMGATFITLSGRFFSLALGQSAMFSGVCLAVMMSYGIPFPIALIATLVIAILLGFLQGGVIAMGANPIITTLGAGALMAGLAGLVTGGKNIPIESVAVEWIGNGRILGVPTQTIAFLISVAVAWFVVSKTRFGRETILLGANQATAHSSGISVPRVTISVFIIATVAAAIMGIFEAAQFSKARVMGFSSVDFDVVAAVLIAGTAIQGGRGSPLQTAIGAVFIATLQNYMLLLAWPSGVRMGVTGAFILLIVVGFHVFGRRKG
ncbi:MULTISPECIES: ABC transporter permease [unclassified Rhizobium]|uniref:ABC transporter permease subunit n=1 Tax=unclassified Rhizobium TaxID=2613769 RepID=UPI0017F1350C|nr:ribose/xylose/arabinose/galactoside ABC-type transport system permease subunit [Rhizobium sp. BK098]MBB3617912.1 ribose/xylose/arabinose/galactoside ABC-type transport system permease subunit [Rhizobium sp. BK609]MBB3683635.1 ribose/xylose/arabinose/galactoside ABC-type transport system permease subunit [Rhizobium sp. BK612]